MPETGPIDTGVPEVPNRLDGKTLSDFAKIGINQIKRASGSYTNIKQLFHAPMLEGIKMASVELLGADWKWKFTRKPIKGKGIDVEIRKFPLKGQNLIEHAVRLRTGKEPLVRSEKVNRDIDLTRDNENNDEAIAEVGDFIGELLAQF